MLVIDKGFFEDIVFERKENSYVRYKKVQFYVWGERLNLIYFWFIQKYMFEIRIDVRCVIEEKRVKYYSVGSFV